jgi:hypothetical protein
MKTEKIVNVLNVALHRYDGTQCEPAIYAKSDSRPGYRWYVGYGGDYRPASAADVAGFQSYVYLQAQIAWESWLGRTVRMYRAYKKAGRREET